MYVVSANPEGLWFGGSGASERRAPKQPWQKPQTSFRFCRKKKNKSVPEASGALAAMQAFLIHILQKAEGKEEDQGSLPAIVSSYLTS